MSENKEAKWLPDLFKTVLGGLLLSSITWLGYQFIGKRIEGATSNSSIESTQSPLKSSKNLLSGLNDILTKWSDTEWTYDSYIDESISILEIDSSDGSNKYSIKGDFLVNRKFTGRIAVGYSCKVILKNEEIVVLKLCYIDKSINDEKCCVPEKWHLSHIHQ
jgi:hypothetical protein